MIYNPFSCPGPGDSETWGPCYGHPNDPRTEYNGDDDEDSESPDNDSESPDEEDE